MCADPNNLPFSREDRSGFENRIVELVARDLGAQVRYTWWAQRRGNVRNTLGEGDCDVVPGVASGVDTLSTTSPYYRSTYVFVARAGTRWAKVASLDDAALREATVGVQLIGDDGANPPPAQALARRGLVANVRGYTVYGDYADSTPQRPILDAVARGDVDLAVAWGPTAGYFARGSVPPLTLTPVSPWLDAGVPMVFDISMGVRREDRALRRELDAALARNREAIARILAEYGVPQLPIEAAPGAGSASGPPETARNP
ncbi:quinoprotein dehydrogenase-associated putative ABC transporter substrate-binding protein [Cognatilysobacter segetis]|uniref:quinoprotein dehydrogenase-associated putative ABC transporter substrate-binding protein n=1 Tax=Cognatilysobacter segetis TaxID=2492394 RepID=UPI00192E469C|nr:quinoprotein dehydrogenase-associated putative ABC transporter substrate-binding protein [Lysobacter segetis]